MSSHHIIRDEQEPAMIITAWDNRYWNPIQQLLGWSPTVIVSAKCISVVILKGIKIDVVIGSPQQLAAVQNILTDQQPLVSLECYIEEDILTKSTQYLLDKGHEAVNIFGDFDFAIFQDVDIQAVRYAGQWRSVKPPGHIFKKWLPKEHYIEVLPSTLDQVFETEGLIHEQGTAYSVATDGVISIRSTVDFQVGEIY